MRLREVTVCSAFNINLFVFIRFFLHLIYHTTGNAVTISSLSRVFCYFRGQQLFLSVSFVHLVYCLNGGPLDQCVEYLVCWVSREFTVFLYLI